MASGGRSMTLQTIMEIERFYIIDQQRGNHGSKESMRCGTTGTIQ